MRLSLYNTPFCGFGRLLPEFIEIKDDSINVEHVFVKVLEVAMKQVLTVVSVLETFLNCTKHMKQFSASVRRLLQLLLASFCFVPRPSRALSRRGLL